MASFIVDSDIAVAQTIDKKFYTDQAYFEGAKDQLFAKSWQFIGSTDLVPEPGDACPIELLNGYINEPLVLVRNKTGQVHVMSNVCTHRGNLIVDQTCRVSNLRCKYHGRQFSLDGRFISMPEFQEVKNFPSTSDNLTTLPIAQFGKWLFTSLNRGLNSNDFFKEMSERIGWMSFDGFEFRPELSRDFTVKAHWALYCENYLEGFHIPFVHAGLNSVIDFGNYTTELFRYSNLQLGIAKDDEDCFDLPVGSPDYGKKVAAYYFFVFPNMMFNFYPWGLSLNIVKPQTIDRTTVSFLTYVLKPELLNTGAGSGLDTVELEDEEIVENVQKGIHSRFYQHGRYSVSREQGTHHFHRIIAELYK